MAHHPKFVQAGHEALALFVAGLGYCNRYRTDGRIPKLVLPSLLPGLSEHRAMELAMRLATNAARPSWIDRGDHYRVHDYEVYQPTGGEAPGEAQRAIEAVDEGGGWGEVTRDVTGYVMRDGDADEAVTRYGNAAERYERYAPLPGPLPPPRPVPVRKGFSTSPASSGWEGEREQARRAQNAERQRRFRERHAKRGGDEARDVMRDVTRYVTRDVTGHVTPAGITRYGGPREMRDGDPPGAATGAAQRSGSSPGSGPRIAPGAPTGGQRAAVSPAERERRQRASNAERQRRFRQRQAALRAGAAGETVLCGAAGYPAPAAAAASEAARCRGEGAVQGLAMQCGDGRSRPPEETWPCPPAGTGRDRGAEFKVWFAGYPRQEAETAAERAWMADPELPPLPVLLERLAVQKAAKPDARFWLAPDRYLRDRRWRDQPPPAPARGLPARSVWAQMRAMGSDEGRRQRLREISAAAMFDPFAAKGSHD